MRRWRIGKFMDLSRSLQAGIVAGSVLLGGGAVQAYTITLTNPFQAGDYFVAANPSTNRTLLQVRPTNPAASQVLFNSGSLGTEDYVGGTFNHDTGDLFYWSGLNGSRKGYLLQEIKADQLTSSPAISDMTDPTNLNNPSILSVAVASDNTVYALQANSDYSHGTIRKFTPNGSGGYNPGTNLTATTNGYALSGATLRIITSGTAKDNYLIMTDNTSSYLTAINASTGAKSNVLGGATGPVNVGGSLAVDYNNPFGDGTLRVLVSSSYTMTGDGTNYKRITELAFNPTTGELSNPFAGGTGNVTAVSGSKTEGVITTTDGQPYRALDELQFDNSGNLVVAVRYGVNSQFASSFTPSQLYPESATLDISAGTTTWARSSLGVDLSSVSSLDIAPVVPEPASLGMALLGLGLIGFWGRRRV